MIWMWDAVCGGLEPQPWHYSIARAQPCPNFPKINPQLQGKGAPICPSTAYQGAKTLCIQMIWMWDTVNGGLQPQPWHLNIIQTQPYSVFPKIHPHLHMYCGIRVHPYAHPQHLKVLKLFVYPIWMWDAINGGLKPQPWHPNIIQAWPYPISPKIHPHLHNVLKA